MLALGYSLCELLGVEESCESMSVTATFIAALQGK